MNILLSKNFYQSHNTNQHNVIVYGVGHAFVDRYVLQDQLLVDYVYNILVNTRDCIQNLHKLDGFFSLVIKYPGKAILYVDRIRSIPLFYSTSTDTIYVSDKAYKINRVIKSSDDPISYAEIRQTGYTINEDTLIKEIKQVEAGTYVTINIKPNKSINTERRKYFQYRPRVNKIKSEKELLEKLAIVFWRAFKKLIKYAGGNKIVVPLSGGLDSRLVVYMLYRMGYKNVLCFTYGKPNNCEAKISKKIAERCNFEWVFIPYTRKMWHDLIRSNEGKKYSRFAGNLTSLAHFQDFMAVKALSSKIPKSSIFVPGHSADFMAGSHLGHHFVSQKTFNHNFVLNEIIHKHYNIMLSDVINSEYYPEIRKKILANMNIKDTSTREGAASAYEHWDYKERQAKYIVNSVRVYDYFNFRWSLPFFYKEILVFWRSVPFYLKYGRKLYLKYLENKFLFENSSYKRGKTLKSRVRYSMPSILWKGLLNIKGALHTNKKLLLDYYNHPMQWYGVCKNYFEYLKLNRKLNSKINSSTRILAYLLDYFYKK